MNQIREQIMAWVARDEAKIVELFSRLVQCETPSPPGDTRQAMALAKDFLTAQELQFKAVDFDEYMPNLISSVQMPAEGRHLMFNGHLDVLPAGDEPGWTDDPWSGKVADGRVWGRGTADMKAGVTAMLFAYSYLARLREQLKGKVSISLVSDEETGYGRGTGYMFEQIENEMVADCVLTGEPSGPQAVCFASKGYLQFTVRVATRGAISGYSNESRSSIHIAAQIISELAELEGIEINVPQLITGLLADPQWRERHDLLMGAGAAELLPKVTVNVGTIQGGSSPSVISPDCTFSVSVVLPVGTDPYQVYSRAREIIERHCEAHFEFEGADAAEVSDPHSEMATILQATVQSLGKDKPDMTPAIAMSDCRYWRYRGTPAFWYGPNGDLCSAANESVSIEELLHTVRTHALAAAEYLAGDTLETLPATVKQPRLASHTPEIKSVAPIRVARLAAKAASFDPKDVDPVIEPLFSRLYANVSNAGVTVGALAIAVFEIDEHGNGRELIVTAAFPVGPNVVAGEGFEVVELPALEMAATTLHRGPVNTTAKTWNSLRRWISKQGCRPKEIYRELYVIGAPNPESVWVTEMQQPVVRRT